MAARILDGKTLSHQLRARLSVSVGQFVAETGVTPKLAAVLVGDDPASAVYVRNKERGCAEAGMTSLLIRLPASTSQAELLAVVHQLNHDSSVHGILVQLPLPRQISAEAILDAVFPSKDVDCFHPENLGLLVQNRPRYLPCTPHGIQVMLQELDIPTDGKHVVVIGRSDIVGKPLAMMLVQKSLGANATVTICHSRTKNLPQIARSADILVAAIGQPEFVTADMVSPGAAVIDVGINRVGDRLVGDVSFGPVSEVASAITPVPGGVGPLTIAMLLKNTLAAARFSHASSSEVFARAKGAH